MCMETADGAFYRQDLPTGVRYLNLHYSADPEKDAEWARKARATFAGDREWQIEMEMQELNLEGKPVHPAYDPAIHAPEALRRQRIPLLPGSTYIAGHDCGTASLNP